MIRIFEDIEEARTERNALPKEVGGMAYANYIRITLDGKYAVISIPADCWLNADTLSRYNLPANTFGWFDEGEPEM